MANSLVGRVFKLDTAGTTSAVNSPVFIDSMLWAPSAGAQSLLVSDRDRNIIWEKTSVAASPAGDETWENPDPQMPFSGFYLTTITSTGVLYVTVG